MWSLVPVHPHVCAVAKLAMFTGDHPAEHRSPSSTSGRESDTPGSGPVCPSGFLHIAHVSVCKSVFVSVLAGTCTWVCEHACPCVCPRERVPMHTGLPFGCAWVYVREHTHSCMHIGVCMCVCVWERECMLRCMYMAVWACVSVCVPQESAGTQVPAHLSVCGCVWERAYVHRFMNIGVCMCLCVEVLAHGHVCGHESM